jgi:nicotinamidase-related amidase
MSTTAKFEAGKMAILTLDIQNGILGLLPGAGAILPAAAKALEAARKSGVLVLHVGLGFEPGYPEGGPKSPRFAMMKEKGFFIKGSESGAFPPEIHKPGETIVYKQRVSAFSENSLRMILRTKGIERLALMGIATSGIVLSTLRQAFDLDFQCTVIKDACFDPDSEVHRVLTEKVFAAQAQVMTAEEFAAVV